MKFLIAFVAVLGYASASVIAPLAYGVTSGDAQAAAINARVAAQDHARAVGESHARAAEAVIQHNTDAARTVAENNRNLHQTAYWGSVAANQNAVAAAQNYAARGVVAGYGAAPLGYAGWGAAPYGIAGLGYNGLGYNGLAYNGLGYHGLGYRAW